jgi:hypothetical protein
MRLISDYYGYNDLEMAKEWDFFYSNKFPFDVTVASKNLLDFINITQSFGIHCFIMFGTLLGIQRKNSLIAHDTDVDLGILDSELKLMLNAHSSLLNNGFRLLREYNESVLITYERDGQYIDLTLFRSDNQLPHNLELAFHFPKRSLLPLEKIEYIGTNLNKPKRTKYILQRLYGLFWFIQRIDSHYPTNKLLTKLFNFLFKYRLFRENKLTQSLIKFLKR